jgi:electron transfer flavoprotein alpha subunit
MKNKRIVVLLKYFKGELNPFDGAALECALETGSKDIIAVSMAPMSALNAFQSLTRLGVKGVFISDPLYAGSDTQATSLILAESVKRLTPDLVFCGRQSVDGDTAQVPPMLAQRLNLTIKTKAIEFNGERVTLRRGETFTPQANTVLTFEKIRTLRFPSIFSKLGEVEIWNNSILQLPQEQCGLKGSPTRVVKSYESSVGRRQCQFVGMETLDALIQAGLQKQRVEQTEEDGVKLDEIYFVGNVKSIAQRIGSTAIELQTQGKTAEEIAKELQEKQAKTVLWEDREDLKILASQVAVLTGAGLCADCISFRVENEKLIMTRPALGGNVTADILCDSEMAFATVRTVKKEGSDVIFSVGKGAVNELEKIQNLAKKYNAEICCSRIVADSGKLPYEKQVGLTGRTVCPKVYVAFGISGAVQHTCAIAGAGTVIAVNVDKQARIFDYADYGIIDDVKNIRIGE